MIMRCCFLLSPGLVEVADMPPLVYKGHKERLGEERKEVDLSWGNLREKSYCIGDKLAVWGVVQHSMWRIKHIL